MKTKKLFCKIGRFIVLALFMLNVILPLYWVIITSFKTHTEVINAQKITLYPHTFIIDNYISLFRDLNYGGFIKNSFIAAVISACIVIIFSLLGGYSLARFKFKGKNASVVMVLMTQMVPSLLVIIPLYLWLSKLGMINTHTGLIIYYTICNIPFCLLTMRSFFERIPYALEESTWIDGCTRLQGFTKIILPVMVPGIVASFAFAFISAWNELIGGTILLNTQDMWTIPVGLKSLVGKYEVIWEQLMAGCVLGLLPTAILFLFMQKYIVSGLTAGAVKE